MCDKPYYIIHKFADFDSDTKHMTRNQRGIYLDLRTLYFTTAHANNGRIDDDFELLCFRLSCHSEADKMDLRLVLTDKFKKIGKAYRHADWDKQIKGIMCEIRKNGRNTGNTQGNTGNVTGNTQGNTGNVEGNTQDNTPSTTYKRKVKSKAKREKILAELASIDVIPSDDAKMKELEALYKAHFGHDFTNGGNTGNTQGNTGNVEGNTQGNTGNAQKAPNNILTNNYKPITNNINNTHTHTQTSEEKNSPVEIQPQSEKNKKSQKSEIDSVIVMDWFNQFWEKYPNKISKGQASKTWMKLFLGDSTAKATESPHQLFEQIITGLERNSEYIKNQANRGYVKHASTWLNASGWLDEVTTVQPITQNSRLPKFGSKDDPLAVNQHWGQPSYVEPNTTPEEWLEMQQAKMKARDLASNRQSQPTGMITL